VCCHHRGVVNLLADFTRRQPIDVGDPCALWTALSFDVSVYEIFAALTAGGTLHIVPSIIRSDIDKLIQWLQQHQIRSVYLPPFILPALIEQPAIPLKRLLVGVEPIPKSRLIQLARNNPQLQIINGYGPTETTICATLYSVIDEEISEINDNAPIGQAVQNMLLYVLDEQQQIVKNGAIGELYIAGVGVTAGYWQQDDLTNKKFITNPFVTTAVEFEHSRLYRTGDLVRYLADGNLYFIGRADHQIKLRGFRIEPGEIETQIRSFPNVQDALVLARAEQLIAYLIIDTVTLQSTELTQQIQKFLQQRLPIYMLPAAYVFLDSFPRTPNDKIDRDALPLPPAITTAKIAATTKTEQQLAQIWTKVLNLEVDSFGTTDNFFALGGHSLLATQLLTRIRDLFQIDCQLTTIFVHPIIAELAIEIEKLVQLPQTRAIPLLSPVQVSASPLSAGQYGWWLFEQMQPGTPAYHIPLAYQLEGDVSIPALEQALQEIVQRHDALRTCFIADEMGKPQQHILSTVNFQIIQEVDKIISPELLHTAACRPFDLQRAPLLRAHLWQSIENSENYTLLLVFHHLIIDGWSVGIVLHELMTLYAALRAQQPSPLTQPIYQYHHFCHWQQHWLTTGARAQQWHYWQQQLQKPLPIIALPSDLSRPALQTFQGAKHPLEISPRLTTALRQLAQQQRVTLFTMLLAAFQTLLHRYTAQNELIVGISTAGRQQLAWEQIVGLFINNLAIRVSMDNQAKFSNFVQQVQEITLAAQTNQTLPFQTLLETLKLSTDLTHPPLFQVFFLMQNFDFPDLQLTDLTVKSLAIDTQTAKLDLSLELFEKSDHLTGWFEYNSDVLTAQWVQQFTCHFERLLAEVIATPEATLSQLTALTSAESRQQLLPATYPDKLVCVHELIRTHAQEIPNTIAVRFMEHTLTYRQLEEHSNQLAHHLRNLGVISESIVGIRLERNLDMIIAILATLKAGGCYLALDPDYPQERLEWMVSDAQIQLVITISPLTDFEISVTDSQNTGQSLKNVSYLCLDQVGSVIAAYPVTPLDIDISMNNLAYLIYTSGSTGQPKGVMIEQGSLSSFCHSALQKYGIQASDKVLQFSSLNFDAAVEEIFPCLIVGGELVLRTADMLDSATFWQRCRAWQITVLDLPTAYWHQLTLDIANHPIPETLRLVLIGGEALRWDRWQAWQQVIGNKIVLFNTYGPTETTVVATALDLTHYSAARAPIGQAIEHVQLYVLDEYLQPVPNGVVGELWIGGIQVARGYLHQPELTAEKFIELPQIGQRVYKTGDLVRYREDGHLEFWGRRDNQVKIRGFRIEPGEVENVLSQHPAVQTAIVTSKVDKFGDNQLIAYVILNSEIAIRELKTFLTQRLPAYLCPSNFVVLDRIPLLPNGKTDLRALPAIETLPTDIPNDFVAPRTPLEQAMAAIWSQILGVNPIGLQDNFFELGGDSLKAARVVNKIQAQWQEIVHAIVLFRVPTLLQFTEYFIENYAVTAAKILGTAVQAVENPSETVTAPMIAEMRQLIRVPPLPTVTAKNPSAIFVLSSPRSGSTLLRVLLAGHPQLFAPPEMYLLSFNTLAERQQEFSGIYRFWGEGTVRAIMELQHCDATQATAIMADFESRGLTTQEFYREMQTWLGNRLLVDKSATYAVEWETLQRAELLFDKPLYINLLRHPYGMIHSFEEARLDQLYLSSILEHHRFSRRAFAELIWYISYENIRNFLAEIPKARQFQLQFEQLVRDPQHSMQQLCTFLGLPFSPDMLQLYHDKQHRMTDGIHEASRMLGDMKFHQHQRIEATVADTWRQDYTSDFLGEVTWELATSLGYPRTTFANQTIQAQQSPEQLLANLDQLADAEVDALLQQLLK
jgi:amino acid adenylation domain-containing protein